MSNMFSPRFRRPQGFLTVLVIALVLRLANVFTIPVDPESLLANDANMYWSGAGLLLETGAFIDLYGDDFVLSTERVPGYYIFLAGIRWLFGPSLMATLIVQSVLDSFTCLLIAFLGGLHSRLLGLAAGLLAAASPNLIIHSAAILTDSLFLFFFTAMLVAAARFLRSGAIHWAAVGGLLLGVATMTRTVSQFLPLMMLPVFVAVPLWYRQGLTRAVLVAVIFLAALSVPLAPLVHRNLYEYDTLRLTTQSGSHLLNWVVPAVRAAADGIPRDEAISDLEAKLAERLENEGLARDALNPFALSRVMTTLALEELSQLPATAVLKAWGEGAILNLISPAIVLDPRVQQLPHGSFIYTPGDNLVDRVFRYLSEASIAFTLAVGLGLFGVAIISLLQLHGFVILIRQAPWAALFAAACVLYFLLVNGPVGSPKYRLPFEPILIILAAQGLLDLFDRWRQAQTDVNGKSPA